MHIGENVKSSCGYTRDMTPVTLRDVIESDLPIFFEQQRDPEANAMAAFPARDREAFMAHWAKTMANPNNILKTILFDGQVAGNIVCWETLGEWEVGYWLGRDFWGKGIASAALTEFLQTMTTRPLFGHVARHNVASKRVLEKCGFTLIGESAYMNIAGEEVPEFVLRLD
jgi:RimJ/RimL family protein N-acetyltransferase